MLKNKLYCEDGIFPNYALNFTDKGKNVVKGLPDEEQNIIYGNLFFKSGVLVLLTLTF